jgi:hypothetical protein
MSGSLPAGDGNNRASIDEQIAKARFHIAAALELLDTAGAPPQLGANVQTALDAVDEYCAGSGQSKS